MYPFFETLKIVAGQVENVEYHQERVNKTFKVFYSDYEPINVQKIVENYPQTVKKEKCRLSYDDNFYSLDFEEYKPKVHDAFKVVDIGDYDYSFKYSNRDFFNDLKAQYPNYEFILVKNGNVLDTTYSNLIFSSKDHWFTPETYLLRGTQREFLLKNRRIYTTNIDVGDIKKYAKFKLINAMMGLENPTEYPVDMIEF